MLTLPRPPPPPQILADIGNEEGVAAQLEAYTDEQLFTIMTDLGGHCFVRSTLTHDPTHASPTL
jgi:hypothetical protein